MIAQIEREPIVLYSTTMKENLKGRGKVRIGCGDWIPSNSTYRTHCFIYKLMQSPCQGCKIVYASSID
ncbi:hypothetical protein NITLEN_11096 [Nitrospira lenta]|uniref:Uncharacterized protein n=1 Tax=Nitrospira lenta TaxID=1436998 RepID=A0A330L2P4_9BACT|nr:hypothetical protein NITLEN_11096 [Nitrospira lenta]